MEQERKETLCSGVLHVERTCSNEQVLLQFVFFIIISSTSSASIMLPSLDCCLERIIKCIMFHAKRDILHSTIFKYNIIIFSYTICLMDPI